LSGAVLFAAKKWGSEEEQDMKTKRLVLFAGAAVIVAGGLIYSLGIYPPASSRDGQGAIGERQVYHADQPADASVTPGAAPVAMTANAAEMKNSQVSQLKNGQLVQMNGHMYQVNTGQLVALTNGGMYNVNGQMVQFNNGMFYLNGNMFQLNGNFVTLMNGGMYQLNGQMLQFSNGMLNRINSNMSQQTSNQLQYGIRQ
jgi:hypothetical protein